MNSEKINNFRENIESPNETESPPWIPSAAEYTQSLEQASYPELAEAYGTVIKVCEAIKAKGGRALLVGGSVRDMAMGKISKDFDLEIYGLEAGDIEVAIGPFGKVSDVGKAFGILKMSLGNGIDIDVSLPRTDSKISEGHRGFEVKTDPRMSIAEAAKRRDFTMNSMAADPLSNEIFDPFGGLENINNKVLRITDEERFRDDPLRVML